MSAHKETKERKCHKCKVRIIGTANELKDHSLTCVKSALAEFYNIKR